MGCPSNIANQSPADEKAKLLDDQDRITGAVLVAERSGVLPGQVYSQWHFGCGAVAFVDSLTPTHHTVFVTFPNAGERTMWVPESVIPLFFGWEVARINCVDGWGLSIKNRMREEVMARVDKIIKDRYSHE